MKKNRRFNDFFHCLSQNKGKRGKNSPFEPRLTPPAKIGHVGVYFAKMAGKIEDGFTDIFGSQMRYFLLERSDRWRPTFTSGLLISFAAKRKKAVAISPWRQPSLFPLILTLLYERIYEYGDKVKLFAVE